MSAWLVCFAAQQAAQCGDCAQREREETRGRREEAVRPTGAQVQTERQQGCPAWSQSTCGNGKAAVGAHRKNSEKGTVVAPSKEVQMGCKGPTDGRTQQHRSRGLVQASSPVEDRPLVGARGGGEPAGESVTAAVTRTVRRLHRGRGRPQSCTGTFQVSPCDKASGFLRCVMNCVHICTTQ